MKLIELVHINGSQFMRDWYSRQIGCTSTYKKYLSFNSEGKMTGVSNHGEIHVLELKRYLDIMEIKNGDKVLCIDDSGQKILKKGNEYTITTLVHTEGHKVRAYIKEHKRFSFLVERFEPVFENNLRSVCSEEN